jgi:hypothetical protein
VSYLLDDSKVRRTLLYKKANFRGTADWAIDLQKYTDDSLDPDGDDEILPDTEPLPPCSDKYNTMEELDAAAGEIPQHCVTLYTLATLNSLLKESLSNYTDMMANGYDGKFKTYAESVAAQAGTTLRDWINTNGTNYFTCTVTETAI